MADQRSSHYNWFKGDSANGGKKSSKESAKTVWKFTKIFLYFSLFFFSMWGCVQTFVMKTSPSVGQGTELYGNKDSISPQVTSIHVTEDASGVYHIDHKADNIWVNVRQDESTFRNIQKEMSSITHDGYTFDEANKGGNQVARIVYGKDEYNNQNQTKGIVYVEANRPLVYTSQATKAQVDHAAAVANFPALVFYKEDGSNNHVISTDVTVDMNQLVWPTDARAEAAATFNVEYAKAILNIPDVKTWFAKTPTTVEEMNAHNAFAESIRNIAQIDIQKDSTNSIKFVLAGNAFGFSSTKYTPVATWAQAWDMHRGAGPFYGIFVYPISWITNKMLDAFPFMSGWESFLAIVLVVVVISAITFLLSFKGTLQQTRMQELNAKKAVIDAKYAPYKGNKQMEMRQRQEVSELYKKEGINPLSSLTTIFVTMPFFLAMWRVIGTIPHIKGTVWLHINFAATSWRELFAGGWQYLPLIAIAVLIQLFSQIYPRLLTRRRDKNRMNVHQKAAMKKGNKMQNIMMIVFAAMAVLFTAGLQVYFIIRSLWRLAEVQLTHHIIVHQRKNRIRKAA